MNPILFGNRMSKIIYAYFKAYVLFECQEENKLKEELRYLMNNVLYLRRTIALEQPDILETAEKLLNEANLTQQLILEKKTSTVIYKFKQKIKCMEINNQLSDVARFMAEGASYPKLRTNWLEYSHTSHLIPFATTSLFIRTANELIEKYIKDTSNWKPFVLLGLKSTDKWDTFSIENVSPELLEEMKSNAIELLENNQDTRLYERIYKYTLPQWIEKIDKAFKENGISLPYINDLSDPPIRMEPVMSDRANLHRYNLDDYNERLERAFEYHAGLISVTYISEKNNLLKNHVIVKYKGEECIIEEKGQMISLLHYLKDFVDKETKIEPSKITIRNWEEIKKIIGEKPTRHLQNVPDVLSKIIKDCFSYNTRDHLVPRTIFKDEVYGEKSKVVKIIIDTLEVDLLDCAIDSCLSAIIEKKDITGVKWKGKQVTISCRTMDDFEGVPPNRLNKDITKKFFLKLKPYISGLLIEEGKCKKCPVFKLIE